MNNFESDNRMRWLRGMLFGGGISLFILITTGGLVSANGVGGACPDWPTCLGSWTPPSEPGALIDYAHRTAVLLTAPFLAGALWISLKSLRRNRLLITIILSATAIFTAQIGLGAWLSLDSTLAGRSWLNALHLVFSLISLAGITSAVVLTYNFNNLSSQLSFHSPFSKLSLTLLASLIALMISGAVVTASGTGAACSDWLQCGEAGIPQNGMQWLNLIHRGLTLISAFFMAAVWIQAWRSQRSQTVILTAATAAGVLFFAQAVLGARLMVEHPTYLIWLHQASAAASLASLMILATAAGLAGRTAADEKLEAETAKSRKRLVVDFLLLTKPIVVLLLLVTTYAGMVIGAKEWPSLSLTFWTMLGGFMAAGGSGAINQFIDRVDDQKMQRTQKRPIPAGRLTPGEGLAFGVGTALASFFIYVIFVNLLSALLALAGIIYYVLLYSIFLKKTTVQNIVIGGGAGAIPPLVGWAAATGSLNIPALFLFAIVFMWTPPHFWALALVRRRDYARAGVPMLPVVRGEKETRSQIMIYTLELVALTLLLPLFGLGGSIYLIGAAALGGWLIFTAYRVWKEGGNKLAWKMYRYSSMYLAFLFVVLMVDRLI